MKVRPEYSTGIDSNILATGSTTERTVEDWLADVINVLSFIPVAEHAAIKAGTSTYDATADIQAAIDAAEAIGSGSLGVGAMVYFPAGTYKITATLTVNVNGVVLRGAGRNSTMILNAGTNIDTIKITNATDGNLIIGNGVYDMAFDYDSADPTAGAHLHLDRTDRCVVQDVILLDHFIGVRLPGAGESTYLHRVDVHAGSNLTATQSGSAGISVERRKTSNNGTAIQDTTDSEYYDEPNSVFISDCNIRGNRNADPSTIQGYSYALHIDAVDGLYCNNCHFMGGETACIHIKTSQPSNALPLSNVIFSNILIDPKPNLTDHGIFYENNGTAAHVADHLWSNIHIAGPDLNGIHVTDNVHRIHFSNLNVRNAGQYAVNLEDGDNFIFSGGALKNSDKDDGDFEHFRINGATDVSISTMILDNAETGIKSVGATTDRVTVMGCIFSNMTNGGAHENITFTATNDDDHVSGCKSNKSDAVASGATISLPLEHDVFSITGSTNIDNIDATTAGGRSTFEGRMVTLIFAGVLTVNDGTGNLALAGNFTTTADDTLTVRFRAGTWYETARSVN